MRCPIGIMAVAWTCDLFRTKHIPYNETLLMLHLQSLHTVVQTAGTLGISVIQNKQTAKRPSYELGASHCSRILRSLLCLALPRYQTTKQPILEPRAQRNGNARGRLPSIPIPATGQNKQSRKGRMGERYDVVFRQGYTLSCFLFIFLHHIEIGMMIRSRSK